MNIDKQHICAVFTEYTDKYNSKDAKIRLKIEHTFRVAAISNEIAQSLELSEDDVNLAWLVGMLHDIGRFEQVRRYNTFSDAESIDHAQFGADLLFNEGLIEEYLGMSIEEAIKTGITDEESIDIIETAIRNHSAFRIEEGLSDRKKMFCNIIRDADKLDILRVNTEFPLEEVYNVTTQELRNALVTKEVLDSFYDEHAVLRKLKKSPIDHVVGHISLMYELVYNKSYEIADKQGWIYKLMDFQSDNDVTRKTMAGVKAHMSDFISNKIKELN